MLTIICDSPGTLSAIDRPKPTRGEGEVLVRIRRVGVCGTDLHIFTGNQPYLSYPRVMGHELAGVVEETSASSHLVVGDTVSIVPYISCGHCSACRKGMTNCCRNIGVLGVHRDGGMTEYLSLPEKFVLKADGLSLDQATPFPGQGSKTARRCSSLAPARSAWRWRSSRASTAAR